MTHNISSPSSCPCESQRESFLFGDLPTSEQRAFSEHMQQCAICQAEIEQHQTFTAFLQAQVPSVSPVTSTELDALLAKIPVRRPQESHATASKTVRSSLEQWMAWLTPAVVLPALLLLFTLSPHIPKTTVQSSMHPNRPTHRTHRTVKAHVVQQPKSFSLPNHRMTKSIPKRQIPKHQPSPRAMAILTPPKHRKNRMVRAFSPQKRISPMRPKKTNSSSPQTKEAPPERIVTWFPQVAPKISVVWILDKKFPKQPYKSSL